MNYIFIKLRKKLLNFCLKVIKKHVDKQDEFFVYTYHRGKDLLNPITWKARGITPENSNQPSETNDWGLIDNIIDYQDKIVFDVGASLGVTVYPFSKKAKEVYAFEPQADNFNYLNDQIKIRGLTNVKAFNFAVSDFNGEADFFNRESHGVHSLGVHNVGKVVSSNKTKVVTLDSFCAENGLDRIGLLKIDVEGFEADVLKGSEKQLKNKLIDFVIFEFSPRIHKLRNIPIDEPIKILLKNDYKIVTTKGDKFVYDDNNLPKICDLIAIPNKII